MVRHSRAYRRRLASVEWRCLRIERIQRTGGRCERCGQDGRRLELHHRTYERLGHELPEDLELLCKSCHRRADDELRETERWATR